MMLYLLGAIPGIILALLGAGFTTFLLYDDKFVSFQVRRRTFINYALSFFSAYYLMLTIMVIHGYENTKCCL